MKKYTLIDIFSGIGGFHKGFLDTDRFELLLSADNNEDCANFHKTNYPTHPFEKVDLSKINEKEF